MKMSPIYIEPLSTALGSPCCPPVREVLEPGLSPSAPSLASLTPGKFCLIFEC